MIYESKNRVLMDRFVEWAGVNHLLLNVDKTCQMGIYFRNKRMASQSLCIPSEDVNMVEDCRYLGVPINTSFKAIFTKGMSRLYFLKEAKSLQHVQQDVGNLLSVCCCQFTLLCCCLLGEQD